MSEAVTVISLIMMTSIVYEESLARDTHTHRIGSSMLKFTKSKRKKTNLMDSLQFLGFGTEKWEDTREVAITDFRVDLK